MPFPLPAGPGPIILITKVQEEPLVDAIECAERTATPIVEVGGAFMKDPLIGAAGEALELDFFEFYGMGRGGVLGDVHADVVASGFVFFHPDSVREFWASARAKQAPITVASAYADALQTWGRDRLAGAESLDELASMLDRIVAGASPVSASLFAGWRAMPLPDDAPARVMQQIHVLRELRGGLHGVAILAEGLSPMEAMVVHATSVAASLFGWPEPHPDPDSLRYRYAAARALTERLVAPAYECLTDVERDRLVELFDGVEATVFA